MEEPEEGNFKKCPGNSPYCLGMVEYDCCGTQGLLEKEENKRKRKKLSLDKPPSKKLALSPSSRFNTVVLSKSLPDVGQ